MNTNPPPATCPQCGKPVSAAAFEGLCPECLLQAGFGTVTGEKERGSAFVPPVPEELAKHFPQLEILELLGRGGMGAVYKVRQIHLDRIVALKILPPSVSMAPSFAERFVREARALAKLHHPNIVTLYESGQADDLFFFLMEFVDGVNLRQLLAAGTIQPKDALAIVPQICDALQFAHDRGIIHRDIKPENILLSKTGQVKIADFGVAKIVAGEEGESLLSGDVSGEGSQTEIGKAIGTPQYMAPEQLSHPLEVDSRADIYALGVVFYQMLTGELPGARFEPPSHKVQIDVRLDEVVMRALEKQPELRYQQASALKTNVETILSTQNLSAVPPMKSSLGIRFLVAFSRWVAVVSLITGLTVLGALLVTSLMTKIYTASAQIQISPRGRIDASLNGPQPQPVAPLPFDPAAFQAEFEILQSPEILLPVINDLKLDQKRGKKLTPVESLAYLKSALKLDLIRGTNIVKVSASSTVPQEAADIANEVANQYKTLRDVQAEQRNSRGVNSLREQITLQQKVVDDQKAGVEKIEQSLGQNVSELPNIPTDPNETNLEILEKDLQTSKMDYDARRVLLESVAKLPDDQFVNTLNGLGRAQPEIDTLRTEISDKQTGVDNLRKDGFAADHPRVVALEAEIKAKQDHLSEMVAGLRRAIQVDTDMAKSRVTLLQKQMDDAKAGIPSRDPKLQPLYDAQRKLQEQQSILDAFNTRLKQIKADFPLLESPVGIVSRAEPPEYPTSPKVWLYVSMAAVIGLLFGIGIASFVEFVLWLRASEIKPSADGNTLLASNDSTTLWGRNLSIAGIILQLLGVMGLIATIATGISTRSSLIAHGPTTWPILNHLLIEFLLDILVSSMVFLLGLILLCWALTRTRYRAKWVFRFLTIYSWPLLLCFPIGTAFAVFFLIYCQKRRSEFFV